MRVFLTGATGFIGAHLVIALIEAGHRVLGLTRSDTGAASLIRSGAEVVRGDVNDLERLGTAVAAADGVIHTAFNHDFTNLTEHSENDRKVIAALGQALGSAERPFVVTSGTGLARRSRTGGPALESDDHVSSAEYPRAATEEAADRLILEGKRVMVVRLPQVHDAHKFGRISHHIQLARQKGRVAYVGDGTNRLAAVHVSDAVQVFRLALEKGRAGSRYNAVGEEGVAMRKIAEAIGARWNLPVESLSPDASPQYFGAMAGLAALDLPASSVRTQRELGWHPTGPDLLTDLRRMDGGG